MQFDRYLVQRRDCIRQHNANICARIRVLIWLLYFLLGAFVRNIVMLFDCLVRGLTRGPTIRYDAWSDWIDA